MDFFTFRWEVAKLGYEWVWGMSPIRMEPETDEVLSPVAERVVPNRSPWLREFGAMTKEVSGRWTAPLEESTGLFLTLAYTEPTRTGIKAFVDAHGLLWQDTDSDNPWLFDDKLPSFLYWVCHILLLRLVVDLWIMARDMDESGLASYIHWRGPSEAWIVTCPWPFSCEQVVSSFVLNSREEVVSVWGMDSRDFAGLEAYIHPEDGENLPTLHVEELLEPQEYGEFSQGNLVGPAWGFVMRIVERQLAKSLSPYMARTHGEELPALQIEPDCLLTALWLQLALAITGNKSYQQCPACPNYFELSPGLNRSDRLFCSNACRTRAYRQRIATAKRLHAEGIAIDSIAQELDTKTETVQKWLVYRRTSGPADAGR